MELLELKEELMNLSPSEGVKLLSEIVNEGIVFSTSFGIEDQVLTHQLVDVKDKLEFFTLDTGRLFPETYDVFQSTVKKYNLQIKTYYPDAKKAGEWVEQNGINAFYNSVENRKACCKIRKVDQLKSALKGKKIWITGLRSEQSQNRNTMSIIEWDDNFKLYKYNPLINYTYSDLESYIDNNKVPVNSLHKKGFVSIGCQPCTRAVMEGEDFRAGRWWWEESKKECGLHS